MSELQDMNGAGGWQDCTNLMQALFRMDANIDNKEFFKQCSDVLWHDIDKRSHEDLRKMS